MTIELVESFETIKMEDDTVSSSINFKRTPEKPRSVTPTMIPIPGSFEFSQQKIAEERRDLFLKELAAKLRPFSEAVKSNLNNDSIHCSYIDAFDAEIFKEVVLMFKLKTLKPSEESREKFEKYYLDYYEMKNKIKTESRRELLKELTSIPLPGMNQNSFGNQEKSIPNPNSFGNHEISVPNQNSFGNQEISVPDQNEFGNHEISVPIQNSFGNQENSVPNQNSFGYQDISHITFNMNPDVTPIKSDMVRDAFLVPKIHSRNYRFINLIDHINFLFHKLPNYSKMKKYAEIKKLIGEIEKLEIERMNDLENVKIAKQLEEYHYNVSVENFHLSKSINPLNAYNQYFNEKKRCEQFISSTISSNNKNAKMKDYYIDEIIVQINEILK